MRHVFALASAVSLVLLASAALAEPEVVEVKVGEHKKAEAEHGKEEAAEGRLPLAQAERPLTLPRFVLNPEAEFNITHHAEGFGTFANLGIGASFGITDDLMVRAEVAPLQLAGSAPYGGFRYGQQEDNVGPGVGLTYRFLRGEFELGASVDASIITAPLKSGIVITPGIPLRIHATKKLRIDAGVYLPITRESADASVGGAGPADPDEPYFANKTGLNVPVSALYDITEPLHVGVATGFEINELKDVGHSMSAPIGVFAGYAIAGKDGPILDIDPFVTFPGLLGSGPLSERETGEFVIGLGVGGFLYL